MSSREIILGRVREALRAPSSRHAENAEMTPWSAPVPETLEGRIELFAANCRSLRAEFRLCPGFSEALECCRAYGWKKIGLHDGKLTDALAERLKLSEVRTNSGYAVADLESCDAGLTECDALVAETGSVLVSTASSGGRALSVLPPHHVVLARRQQLVPNLAAAFQLVRQKRQDNWPSMMSFITGPSRTGDIERILVLGAHGPKKLTIPLRIYHKTSI